MASATMPGSMISPSTMASASNGTTATRTSSGSLREWSITATLIRPDPISRPTVVLLRPNRAIGRFGGNEAWPQMRDDSRRPERGREGWDRREAEDEPLWDTCQVNLSELPYKYILLALTCM